jgi:hypothetical protein
MEQNNNVILIYYGVLLLHWKQSILEIGQLFLAHARCHMGVFQCIALSDRVNR